jgi:predicted acyltransferase
MLDPQTAQRDQSLDALRGTDVLLMIIVNVQGSEPAAFPLLKHAEWNGLTLADLVFPIFLLIVGLSTPLAFDRPGAVVSWPAILKRAFWLFMIGVGLSWLIHPTLDPDLIRWTGVLQRIAVGYVACAAVVIATRGAGVAAALAVAFLVFHTLMLLYVGSPPSMAPGMGISGWLDQHFIPGRVLRTTWEPEGILSTVSAIANGLIGVAVMRRVRARGVGAIALGGVGLALIVAGLVISPIVPVNKNLWTASFALVTCGIGVAFWAMLKASWPQIGGNAVVRWTVTLGQAALTLYVVHHILIAIIVRTVPSGDKLWKVMFDALAGTGMDSAIASLLFASIAATISCVVLPWLKQRGWILKV